MAIKEEQSPPASERSPPLSEGDATQLRIAGSWLQALTDGSKEIVALMGPDGTVEYLSVSGAVQHILGYDALTVVGMKHTELLHPLDCNRVVDAFQAVAAHPGARLTIAYRARHRAGHYVRLESTAVNRLRNEHVAAIVVHTRELHTAEPPHVRTSAAPQPLLETKDALFAGIEESIEKAAGGTYHFSAMVLEIERRDSIAEAYGPDVAQAVQAEVGRRLSALLRPGDMLAQLDGGEFAILLDGVGDRALAERIAIRIQKTVGNRFTVKGKDILCSAVVGIATSQRRYEHAADVLRDAALATRQARGEGPGQRAVYRTQMHIERARHMSLVAELHNAMQRNQFRVYYFPVVGLATRTICGFEALLRWDHPERGVISPALFLPIAEEIGLVNRLGRWVMLDACRQMLVWQKRYELDPPLWLCVNLSAKQFADLDLDEQVTHILQDTDLDPSHLVLEVEESAVIEHGDAVGDMLHRLGRHGVKFSLDNFGVGTASFTRLHQLPFDRLKIDRSLVAKMDDPRGRDIVKATVSMAHDLSMEVVAEGVEDPGQATQLSSLWCEYAQGYLFGKPMPADAAGALIASYPRWWSE